MSGKRIIVIGGGAAGMMAAGRAARLGARVTLLEKMERPGRKILISGNGRCNLTNSRSIDDFIPMYGKNGRFLHRAFKLFFRDDLLNLLAGHGVRTITGEDRRVFPESGRSADVVRVLTEFMTSTGAEVITGTGVLAIEKSGNKVTLVRTPLADHEADAVILAAGGASYPQTGSTGEGCRMAERLGHSIVKLRPALVPLILEEQELVRQLQGISLKGVRISSFSCISEEIKRRLIPAVSVGRGIPGKRARPPVIESRTGDLLFTHYGVSGPAILLMSLPIADALELGAVSISIDLLPGKDEGQLDRDLQDIMAQHGSRSLRTISASLTQGRVADVLLKTASIDPDKEASQVTTKERRKTAGSFKSFTFNIRGTRPLEEAMVTAGGVSLDEVNPQTMESRLVKGLYFCGEVLDIDADTGGFNLQAAFSTGYLAGECAAQSN